MKNNEEESGQNRREVKEETTATRSRGENINKNISDDDNKNYYHNERSQEQQVSFFIRVCWKNFNLLIWNWKQANDKQQAVVVGQMFLFRGGTTTGCGLWSSFVAIQRVFRVSVVVHCWDANKMYLLWIFVETINALCKRSLTGKVRMRERRAKLEAANASWRLMWNWLARVGK